jgi:hypothetical protein
MRRARALDRGGERQDDLARAHRPRQKRGDGEVVRPHPAQRGERAAEDVIRTVMRLRALQRPELRHALDDADQTLVALVVRADVAGVAGIEIAAIGAGLHRRRRRAHRIRQGQHAALRLHQHAQGGPPRAAPA